MDLITIIQTCGPVAGIIIFYMYRDWKREAAMSLKLDEKDKQILKQAKEMQAITIKYNEAIGELTTVLKDLTKQIGDKNVSDTRTD